MQIRRLTPADAPAYRALMLRAYASDPAAFTATVPEREPLPLEWWTTRMSERADAPERVFGAFVDGVLAGAAGVRFEERARIRHKGWLYGMCVAPEHRGRGIARVLVEAVLEAARAMPGVLLVQLTVAEPNVAARRLYEACGFRAFGTEPLALRIEERFVPLVHMWRLLHDPDDREPR